MIRELHAARGDLSVQGLTSVMKDEHLNAWTRAELLCTALPTRFKELARAHYRSLILSPEGQTQADKYIDEELARMQSLGLARSVSDALDIMPPYSLGIEFSFTLSHPYLSSDDDAFYIIDNPVRKEKVFRVPYMAATGWKGGLRAAATRDLLLEMDRVLPTPIPENATELEELYSQLWSLRASRVLLFGNEKEACKKAINEWLVERLFSEMPAESEEERFQQRQKYDNELKWRFEKYLKDKGYRTERIEGRQGRLYFFPTYFNRLGLEIINPHDRERGVGTNPILLECVPSGAGGRFGLLYVPFDYPGGGYEAGQVVTPDKATLIEQISSDLPRVAKAICALLTVYGFGAKTSSGYGTVEDALPEPGQLVLKARIAGVAEQPLSIPELEPYLIAPDSLEDFIAPEANLRSEDEYREVLQQRGQDYTRKKRRLYRKVKEWWERVGATQVSQYLAAQAPDRTMRFFSRLSELPQIAQQLAEALKTGGAA